MNLAIETEREVDGCWIAEVPELPGCLAYGATESEAAAKVEALALRVLADQLVFRINRLAPTHRRHPGVMLRVRGTTPA